ncbi:hypothetical protein HNV12_04390 [Methanococcoides sp. SA1]|nr:hypothetical protein [Methanococcoides sp. SA1]
MGTSLEKLTVNIKDILNLSEEGWIVRENTKKSKWINHPPPSEVESIKICKESFYTQDKFKGEKIMILHLYTKYVMQFTIN